MLPCAHLHLRPTAPKKPRNACVGPPPRPGGRATALQHRKLTSTRLVNSLWHQTQNSTIAGRDAQSDSECLVVLLWFIRLCAPLCPCLALSDSRAPVGPLGLHNFPHSHRVALPPPSTFWNSERYKAKGPAWCDIHTQGRQSHQQLCATSITMITINFRTVTLRHLEAHPRYRHLSFLAVPRCIDVHVVLCRMHMEIGMEMDEAETV